MSKSHRAATRLPWMELVELVVVAFLTPSFLGRIMYLCVFGCRIHCAAVSVVKFIQIRLAFYVVLFFPVLMF